MPKNRPEIVEVPPVNYIAVRGKGDPNEEGSEYKASIGLLYAIAFTIKMSKKGSHPIEGYFDYVVPPLEGFWWQEHGEEIDYSRKEGFRFISVIRLPDFVTEKDFAWALEEAARKKGEDFSKVEFLTCNEGLCVQCMHIGSYDQEPETIGRMHDFMKEQGYELDITEEWLHHEIYSRGQRAKRTCLHVHLATAARVKCPDACIGVFDLSDVRRVAPEKWKTVIRHPVKPAEGRG